MDAFETKPQPSSTPARYPQNIQGLKLKLIKYFSLCTELGSKVDGSVEPRPAAPLVEVYFS